VLENGSCDRRHGKPIRSADNDRMHCYCRCCYYYYYIRRRKKVMFYVCQLSVCLPPTSAISSHINTSACFHYIHTPCSKKVVGYTKFISITWSNLNGFLKFFHCHTLRKICYKLVIAIPPHLKRVATLPCETQML